MKLNESQKIMKYLSESMNSQYSSILDDLYRNGEAYVRLDEKDYSSEEGSNIYKIVYSSDNERPEDYDNGYNSGWDRGKDEEYDKKQDERFEKATKAFENGDVFEFLCVKAEDGAIKPTGFCLLKAFGEDELIENLEYYNAKPVKVRTTYAFEEGED